MPEPRHQFRRIRPGRSRCCAWTAAIQRESDPGQVQSCLGLLFGGTPRTQTARTQTIPEAVVRSSTPRAQVLRLAQDREAEYDGPGAAGHVGRDDRQAVVAARQPPSPRQTAVEADPIRPHISSEDERSAHDVPRAAAAAVTPHKLAEAESDRGSDVEREGQRGAHWSPPAAEPGELPALAPSVT